MSSYIEHVNDGRRYLLVTVMSGAKHFQVYGSTLCYGILPDEGLITTLPLGEWSPLGIADQLGEDVAARIAPTDPTGVKGWYEMVGASTEDSYRCIATTDPVESLASLIRSHGLDPKRVLILEETKQ